MLQNNNSFKPIPVAVSLGSAAAVTQRSLVPAMRRLNVQVHLGDEVAPEEESRATGVSTPKNEEA